MARSLRGGRRIATIIDQINELESPNFLLQIQIISAPITPPSARGLKYELVRWLSGLSPEEISRLWGEEYLDEVPNYPI